MKPSKFLLAENPIADQSDGRLFIIHNRDPKILAEVHHYQNLSEADMLKIQSQIPIGGRLDYQPETIYFTPVWIEGNAEQTQEYADKLAGIFRRMADWYKAYLIWEDKKLEQ